jgi:pSer/pThr/pTyr-binding forkhead associated (FHA) protein
MPFVSIIARRHQLRAGNTTLGGGDGVDIAIPAVALEGPAAVLIVTHDGNAVIRRADPGVAVSVDGRLLGDEPRSLAHGSKIEILGAVVLYGDERHSGTTRHVAGVGAADPPSGFGEAEPAADTGGVLVSLRDGRVYPVPDAGLDIGRDPHCDLVIASSAVSRWHAQVAPGLLGYVIADSSSNGVLLNGAKIEGTATLARGDVIRVGPEEFRFDADAASFEPSGALLDGQGAPRAAAAERPPEVRARTAEVPTLAPAVDVPVLARLEIVSRGLDNGTSHDITHQLSHLGRGAHNDVVLDDRSVSGAHAKLQLRGEAWYVVDMESTNGTYVDGERVRGERRLPPIAELRFGDIRATFRAAVAVPSAGAGGGDTRKIVGATDGQVRSRSSR